MMGARARLFIHRTGARILALGIMFGFGTPAAEAQGWPPLGPPQHPMMQAICADPEARFAARMAFIQAKVVLKTEQKAEWEAFVAAVRAAEKPFWDQCKTLPAPPRADDPWSILDARDRIATMKVERDAALRAALGRLRNALAADQQRWLGEAVLTPEAVGFGPPGFPARPPRGPGLMAPGFGPPGPPLPP